MRMNTRLCRCAKAADPYAAAAAVLRPCRQRRSAPSPPRHSVPTMRRSAAAATVGLIFSRMLENICRASVLWFGPATNRVSTTSSREVAKAKIAPDTTPGIASGKVTRRNTVTGGAPKAARGTLDGGVDPLQGRRDADDHEGNAQNRMCNDDAEIGARKPKPNEEDLHADAEDDGGHHHREQEQGAQQARHRQSPFAHPEGGQRAEHGRQHRRTAADDEAVDDGRSPHFGRGELVHPAHRVGGDG